MTAALSQAGGYLTETAIPAVSHAAEAVSNATSGLLHQPQVHSFTTAVQAWAQQLEDQITQTLIDPWPPSPPAVPLPPSPPPLPPAAPPPHPFFHYDFSEGSNGFVETPGWSTAQHLDTVPREFPWRRATTSMHGHGDMV